MTHCVAIIGAGAAGLMAADHLSELMPSLSITLYDAMPSPARKILMAGKSGLNITHSEKLEHFISRYGEASDWMAPMLADFGPTDVRALLEDLGQETFVGSSGRVFPKVMKASPFLRNWLSKLAARGVELKTRHRWCGWDEHGALRFDTPDGLVSHQADATLLALGGPSWPRLGTDGAFLPLLENLGLEVRPYRSANCGFDVAWSEHFIASSAGEPIKSVCLKHGTHQQHGDFVISRYGIEGSAVYALSAGLRDEIEQTGRASLQVDLRPHQSVDQIAAKLSKPRGKASVSNFLRKQLNLKGPQAALLRECTEKELFSDMEKLAKAIKSLPLPLSATRPLSEAISSAGGVCLSDLKDDLSIDGHLSLFMAGEMLDWEAPTGGYLLTGCMSQGYRAAQGMANYLGSLQR